MVLHEGGRLLRHVTVVKLRTSAFDVLLCKDKLLHTRKLLRIRRSRECASKVFNGEPCLSRRSGGSGTLEPVVSDRLGQKRVAVD